MYETCHFLLYRANLQNRVTLRLDVCTKPVCNIIYNESFTWVSCDESQCWVPLYPSVYNYVIKDEH